MQSDSSKYACRRPAKKGNQQRSSQPGSTGKCHRRNCPHERTRSHCRRHLSQEFLVEPSLQQIKIEQKKKNGFAEVKQRRRELENEGNRGRVPDGSTTI